MASINETETARENVAPMAVFVSHMNDVTATPNEQWNDNMASIQTISFQFLLLVTSGPTF